MPPPPKKYLYQPNGAVWTGYVRDSRNRKVAVRFEQFGGVALKTLPLPPKYVVRMFVCFHSTGKGVLPGWVRMPRAQVHQLRAVRRRAT